MAERISPESPGFRNQWFQLRKGFIPWISFRPNPFRQAFLRRYQWVSQHTKGLDVLDVPCGMGWGTSLIQNTNRLVGIDIAADAVEEASQRYGHLAEFVVGSMAQLEFPDSTFDVVACLEGIEHVDQQIGKDFVTESHRVLKPGGRLLISSPHTESGEHSGNPFHIYEYPTDELRDILSKHFEVELNDSKKVANLVVDYFVCHKA